jgi:hypothetical protein
MRKPMLTGSERPWLFTTASAILARKRVRSRPFDRKVWARWQQQAIRDRRRAAGMCQKCGIEPSVVGNCRTCRVHESQLRRTRLWTSQLVRFQQAWSDAR